jgi:hypothetical protein
MQYRTHYTHAFLSLNLNMVLLAALSRLCAAGIRLIRVENIMRWACYPTKARGLDHSFVCQLCIYYINEH